MHVILAILPHYAADFVPICIDFLINNNDLRSLGHFKNFLQQKRILGPLLAMFKQRIKVLVLKCMRVRREVMLIAESGSSHENKASETLPERRSPNRTQTYTEKSGVA